mgnify:CR=1 FL=1
MCPRSGRRHPRPAQKVKRGVGPRVAQRDGLPPLNSTEAKQRPRKLPEQGSFRGRFLFSASQGGRGIVPHVLPLPSLELPTLVQGGGTDIAQFPTVRALAGLGPGLQLKVAVIANKNHFFHAPHPIQYLRHSHRLCPACLKTVYHLCP